MKLVMQPDGSSLCGQSCVAMLAGVSLDESIKAFGTRGGTRTKQLAAALASFGIKACDHLTRIKLDTVLPEMCIVKMVWRSKAGKPRGHWMVHYHGDYYCPSNGVLEYWLPEWGKITSFLEVF